MVIEWAVDGKEGHWPEDRGGGVSGRRGGGWDRSSSHPDLHLASTPAHRFDKNKPAATVTSTCDHSSTHLSTLTSLLITQSLAMGPVFQYIHYYDHLYSCGQWCNMRAMQSLHVILSWWSIGLKWTFGLVLVLYVCAVNKTSSAASYYICCPKALIKDLVYMKCYCCLPTVSLMNEPWRRRIKKNNEFRHCSTVQ